MRPPPPKRPQELLDNGDPPRLLASDSGVSAAARSLLLSPPPVKPLDASTAMRVRAAVLQAPGATFTPGQHPTSPPPSTWAYLKLGAVAGSAAVFGAGVMTVASGFLTAPTSHFGHANDRSGVVVVSGAAGAVMHSEAGGASRSPELTRPTESQPRSAPHGARWRQEDGTHAGSAEGLDGAHLASKTGPEQTDPRVAESDHSGKSHQNDARVVHPQSAVHGDGVSVAGERNGGAVAPVLSVSDLESVTDEPMFTPGASQNVMVRPAFRKIAAAQTRSQVPPPPRETRPNSRPSHLASNSLEAETLLLEEARSKLGREPEAALTLAMEHQTRYRRGQLLEQRRMIHLEALLRLGRDEEALALAKTIGNSLYRARAAALLSKYGI